jgi:prevent-host-death family protein
MKRASISETKNRLSELLERVRHGETVLITDRERPVARLESVGAARSQEVEGRLSRLARAGLPRVGSGAPVKRILSDPAPRLKKGVSAVAALLDERKSGAVRCGRR